MCPCLGRACMSHQPLVNHLCGTLWPLVSMGTAKEVWCVGCASTCVAAVHCMHQHGQRVPMCSLNDLKESSTASQRWLGMQLETPISCSYVLLCCAAVAWKVCWPPGVVPRPCVWQQLSGGRKQVSGTSRVQESGPGRSQVRQRC